MAVNKEVVNDTAKLIMHRLIARMLRRDRSLVVRATISHARMSAKFPGKTFVRDWFDLLARPIPEIRSLLVSRSLEMNRLRLSSPFVIADGIDFSDPALRRRIWACAGRLAVRANSRDAGSSAARATAS
jgi:hypothetical protein